MSSPARNPSGSRTPSGSPRNSAPIPSSPRTPSGSPRNSAQIPSSSRSAQSPAQMASRPRTSSGSAHNSPGQSSVPASDGVTGHMFRCTAKWDNSKGDVLLRVDEGGVILQLHSVDWVRVEVDRRPKVTLDVPLRFIRVGVRKLDGPLPVDFRGVLHTPITSLSRSIAATTTGNDLRNHIAAVLAGISEVQDRMPFLKAMHTRWLESPARVQEASTLINAGVLKCSPRLVGVLLRKDFTFRDVAGACPNITDDNHSCGVYVRFYGEFRVSVYFDDGVYEYVGQTNDMNRRNKEHLNSRANPGDSLHYNVAGNASIVQAVQLCELDEYAGGTKDAGQGLRDICEQLFILLLGSYHPSVLQYRETYAQKNLAQAIHENFDSKDLARTYSEIAQVSLAKTGFALPGLPGRQKDFGTHSGLNKESPMGMGSRHDKMLWTVQDAGDKWVMQRSALVVAETRVIFQKQGFIIKLSKNEHISYAQAGDTVYLSVDIMKPNAGEHRSPYFRCPNIGPFSNRHYANKVAFKIVWRSAKDKLLRRSHLQQISLPDMTPGEDTPGCSNLYAMGIALYAFFTRSHWKDKPDFVPDFGRADLLFVDVDMFNQKITTKLVADSMVMLPKVEFLPKVARLKMRDIGYLNIDGEWNPIGESRTKCDSCTGRTVFSHVCERIGNSNLCRTCKLLGIPCSWTKSERQRERNLDVTADFYKLPIDEQATTSQVFTDPGYQILTAS